MNPSLDTVTFITYADAAGSGAFQYVLKIPLLFGADIIHGFKTVTPIPLGEAASWDLNIIEKSARLAALEATASGISYNFAPMVDISRDPRWDRVSEGAGEDPLCSNPFKNKIG